MTNMAKMFSRLGRNLKRLRGGDGHWQSPALEVGLVEHLPQAVFQLNNAGRWTYLNAAWTELAGHTVESSIGNHHQHYFHPQDSELIAEHLRRTLRRPRGNSAITVRLLRKDGASRWVALRTQSQTSGDNSSGNSPVVGTLTDVTRRVHGEEVKQAKQRTLEKLTANLPGMLYRCRNDPDWTMEYVSEGSVALTGFRPEEIVANRKTSWANIIHPDDRDRIWDECQYSLQRHEPFELLYRVVTASGDVKWVLEGGQGTFTSGGGLLGVEGFVADITQKKIAEDRLRHAALYDADTDLPNPSLFADRLQCTIKKRPPTTSYLFALLLVSVDQYAEIVESHGVQHADQLMAKICRRLHEAIRAQDSICQLRNNRLGVLLDDVGGIKGVTTALQRIQEQVQAPVAVVEDSDFYTTASIGVALGDKDYKSSDAMMADANTALSRAKSLGGARYEISDLRSHAKVTSQSQIEAELQEALDNNGFRVFWQPVVGLKDRRIAGVEAKMGWLHRRRGLLFTESFVSHAQETQLITPLWQWMLTEARRQIDAWQTGTGIDDVALTVQISGNTLLDAESILRLGKQLLAAKLPPFRLALAVPAHVLTRMPRTVERMLKRVNARNIQLILEAFGAGDVTLSTVREMPIDAVKLDPRLVAECANDDGRYIAALVAFARRLGITVIADGVETQRQFDILQAVDVDYVQGNYISPPVDAEATREMLENVDHKWLLDKSSEQSIRSSPTPKVVIQTGH